MPGARTTGGDLRHRVTIRRPNASADGAGQMVDQWNIDKSLVARDVPAAFQAVSGGERARGLQIEAGETALFTLRYRSDVTPEMRLYLDGEPWNIVRAVDPDGTRKRLLCTCMRTL